MRERQRFKFRVIRFKDKISGRPYHCKVYNDIALCALNIQFVSSRRTVL